MGFKGSYLGFTFNDIHSSSLGIVRTGDPYLQNTAMPTIKDKTTEIVGRDGAVYFGASLIKQVFPTAFAFVGVTEEQLRAIKQLTNDKQIHDLIFDEHPYKVYSAKITDSATISHIAFEKDGARFYNGSGTLTFTAFYPLARSRLEYLEDYNVANILEWSSGQYQKQITDQKGINSYFITEDSSIESSILGTEEDLTFLLDGQYFTDSEFSGKDLQETVERIGDNKYCNLEEWRNVSGIPSDKDYGVCELVSGKWHCKVFNAGDVAAPFEIFYEVSAFEDSSFEIRCGSNTMKIEGVRAKISGVKWDACIGINSGEETIQGYDQNFNKTNFLYNDCLTEGRFFLLPPGESTIISNVKPNYIKLKYLYY